MVITKEQFDEVCDRLRAGGLVVETLKDMQIPPISFYKQVAMDDAAQVSYTRAIEQRAHALAERTMMVAEDISMDPHRARNIISAMQWVAGKQNRRIYGEKMDIDVTNKIDIAALQLAARQRVLAMRDKTKLVEGQRLDNTDIPNTSTADENAASPALLAAPSIFE